MHINILRLLAYESEKSAKFPLAANVGIIIGIIVALTIIGIVVYKIVLNKKKKKREDNQ